MTITPLTIMPPVVQPANQTPGGAINVAALAAAPPAQAVVTARPVLPGEKRDGTKGKGDKDSEAGQAATRPIPPRRTRGNLTDVSI